MTAGQLAQRTRLTTGAITKIVDRLADAGYVRRAGDPRDRRRVIVEFTDRTRRLADDLYAIPEAALTDSQHQFGDDDIEVVIRYFEHGQAAADLRMTSLKAKPGAGRPEPAILARVINSKRVGPACRVLLGGGVPRRSRTPTRRALRRPLA